MQCVNDPQQERHSLPHEATQPAPKAKPLPANTTIRRRRPVMYRVLCALAVLPVALWAGIGHLLKHTGEWMIDVTH